MGLADDLERIAAAAAAHADGGVLEAALAAEPASGSAYVCAFETAAGACTSSRSTATETASG